MIEAGLFVCDVSFEVFSLVEGAFDRLGILTMQESPMSTGCNELLGVNSYSWYILLDDRRLDVPLIGGKIGRLGILSMQESLMSTGCNELLGELYSWYIFGTISRLSSLSLLGGEGSSSDEENTMRGLLDIKSE